MLVPDFVWGGGGAERVAVAIAVHLPPEGYEAYVCTIRTPPDDTLEAALAGTGVRHLDMGRTARLDLPAFWRLFRILRTERIDVLHTHMFGANVWGTVIGRLSRVPVVIAHEHTWSYVGQPIRRLLDGLVISRLADKFVAVSSADRNRMISIEHVRPTKITVIPTAYLPRDSSNDGDVRAELGIGVDVPVVATIAIMRPQKALQILIEAFSLLPERLSNARLLLVGDGLSRPALQSRAAELGVQDRVHFLGIRDDPDAVWRASDVAAMSSDFEGTPLAVIEAMTHGIPLAATAVGGVAELLEHDVNALLVQPRDPPALARALTRLLDDPALRTRLAAEARRGAQDYSLERLMKRTENMYVALLSASRRSSRRRRGHPLANDTGAS